MGSGAKPKFYGDDLAHVHDTGYSRFINESAPGILSLLASTKIQDGTVVDLGCGAGRLSAALARAGYQVIGVDVSPAMVRLARANCPSATFHAQSAWTFPLPRCRAVVALGEVLAYRTDDSRYYLPSLLRRIHAALEPGGLLAFDLAEIGTDRDRQSSAVETDDWACLVRYEYDDRRDRLSRRITVFRRAGRVYRRTHEHHVLQLYKPGQVAQQLRKLGFRVRLRRSYGDHSLLPGRVAFIARKSP